MVSTGAPSDRPRSLGWSQPGPQRDSPRSLGWNETRIAHALLRYKYCEKALVVYLPFARVWISLCVRAQLRSIATNTRVSILCNALQEAIAARSLRPAVFWRL